MNGTDPSVRAPTALRLLAIETSSPTGSVALAVGDAVEERTIATPREQTERVLVHVEALMAEAGLALAELDAVVFGRGPGSFTGLRVAAAVAQGLSLAAGTPIVPVSSLAALARRALAANAAVDRVLCVVDARMGEVYSGSFRRVDGGIATEVVERIGPPHAVAIGPEAGALRPDVSAIGSRDALAAPAGAWIAVGDGFEAYGEVLAGLAADAVAVDATLRPRARDLLPLARVDVAARRFVPIALALPVYLREADAWRRY